MALIAFGRAFRTVRVLMTVYADLVGIILAETGDFAGGFLVAGLAIALHFIHVIIVIEDHFAVPGRKFHAILQIGGRSNACKSDEEHYETKFFHRTLTSHLLMIVLHKRLSGRSVIVPIAGPSKVADRKNSASMDLVNLARLLAPRTSQDKMHAVFCHTATASSM